jgi:eukaryotic-like serine/threonine-protein kinase
MDEKRLLNNRYELIERIGKGGMAAVYRARDVMLERTVAIKVLREDFSGDPVFQERFRQEARAAANLAHPNIVTVHDFGLDNGQLFIVMENIPGADLKTLLKKRGRFTPEEALPLIIQACAGLGYAHRAGLVHCDVKPQNLLVTPDKRLKVTDFGIARALATIQPDEKSDIVWGSPQYFAPEQASGDAPSPASDVYSLGIILFELLTGTLPFRGTSATDLAHLHLEAEPPLISELLPEVPPALEQILMKVLAKEPAQRYRTADQLGRVLLNFGNTRTAPSLSLTPEMATDKEPETPTAQREDTPLHIDWLSVGLGLLAMVAVLGLIPFWMWVYFAYNPPIH